MDDPNDSRAQQRENASSPSASQTSQRRVADVGEIEELHWDAERRRRKRRRSLFMIWALFALAAIVAVYAVAARSLVVNARQRYREVYRSMDLSVYRAFNSTGLRQAEQQYREAETMNPYLQTPAILSAADKALQTLRANYEKAREKESRFEKLRETYNVRRQEAQDVGLPELLPDQWARLRELEKSFRSDLSPSQFDYNQAKKDVAEGIAILNSLRRHYDELREYARVLKLQQETLEAMNPDEWRINRPKLHARMEKLREHAEIYAENREWSAATQALQQFQQLREDHWREIAELRSQAEKKMAKAQEAMTGDNAETVKKAAEQQFAELSDKRQRMEQAFLEYRYEDVEKLAQEILTEMQTLKEEAQTLEDSRESLMVEFKTLWKTLENNQTVFRQNWPERWDEIRNLERQIRMLEPDDGRQIELVQALRQAVNKLEELVKMAREEANAAVAKRKQFQDLVDDTDMELLGRNLPEQRDKIRQLRLTAQNWWDERMYSRATEDFAKAGETLQQAQAKLEQLRESAKTLWETVPQQMDTYARGLEVFVPDTLEEAQELKQDAQQALDDQSFAQAISKLEALEKLMPEKRCAAQENGTVRDFVSGLLWGAAPEAGSADLDWYDALTYADDLSFADITEWKLPTRDELLTLQDLSAERRKQLFPTLSDATVWTSENVAQGGTTAYVVTMPEFETAEAPKTQQNLALPVHTPE
ncbi:MAG: DUF1566 domain-containing protein [Verrucomicrobiota bacterium]